MTYNEFKKHGVDWFIGKLATIKDDYSNLGGETIPAGSTVKIINQSKSRKSFEVLFGTVQISGVFYEDVTLKTSTNEA